MPVYRVYAVLKVSASEMQDAENEIYDLLERVDAGGLDYDWEITDVLDYDSLDDEEEFVVDEW